MSDIVKEGITREIQIAYEKEEIYEDGRGGGHEYDQQI